MPIKVNLLPFFSSSRLPIFFLHSWTFQNQIKSNRFNKNVFKIQIVLFRKSFCHQTRVQRNYTAETHAGLTDNDWVSVVCRLYLLRLEPFRTWWYYRAENNTLRVIPISSVCIALGGLVISERQAHSQPVHAERGGNQRERDARGVRVMLLYQGNDARWCGIYIKIP